MAVDAQQDPSIVIRIVYDGPPEVGKTTSVRALARSFGRQVFTPEEQDGRTVYLDWLEHVGGRFDGAPIRCQVASVPGQQRWRRRRNLLVDQADVVVFVGDTSAAGWSESRTLLRRLLRRLQRRDGPTVGVVFQANRRDVPDALPLALVQKEIGAENVVVIESVAVDGVGVREAFVFAVRLALDRVRELQQRGPLAELRVATEVGDMLEEMISLPDTLALSEAEFAADVDDVLEELEEFDELSPDAAVEVGEPPKTPADGQLAPTHEVQSGLVWPPIEGRVSLCQATIPHARGVIDGAGHLSAVLANGWYAQSFAGFVFDGLDEGRERLIEWARAHASAQVLLSRQRCIALAETGDGRWRLWQVVLAQRSLRDIVLDAAGTADAAAMVQGLGLASRILAEASTTSASLPLRLPCTLDTIGVSDVGRPVYVKALPFPGVEDVAAHDETTVAHELGGLLRLRDGVETFALHEALRHTLPAVFGPGSRVRDLLLESLEVHRRGESQSC